MKTSAGLWLDHKLAVIVELGETGAQIHHLPSRVEKQRRRAGGPAQGRFPAQDVPRDDSREREYQGGLARYYDEIISRLRTADEILILGPGEAKHELKKRFERVDGAPHRLTLATEDKMTEPQLVARVGRHFHQAAPRRRPNSTVSQPQPQTQAE